MHAHTCIGYVCTCDHFHQWEQRTLRRIERAMARAARGVDAHELDYRLKRVFRHAERLGWLSSPTQGPPKPFIFSDGCDLEQP